MSVSPEQEQELDDLLDKINGELDRKIDAMKQHKKKTPTQAFSKQEIDKRTKQVFAALSEDILEDSGENVIDTQTMRLPPKKTDSVFGRLFGKKRIAPA